MPRKARLGALVRRGSAAGIAGAAWLGLGLILADENPAGILGLIAALLALAGGWAARVGTQQAFPRAVACLLPVLLARLAAGPLAAVLAAGCVAAGWWLRVRPSDAALVLALLGGGVAAVSPPSVRLVLAFALLGVLTVGIRPALAAARRGLRRIASLPSHGPLASGPGRSSREVEGARSAPAAPLGDAPSLLGDER